MNPSKQKKIILGPFQAGDLIRQLFLAWLMACCLEFLLLESPLRAFFDLTGLASMSFPRVIGLTAVFTLALHLAGRFLKSERIERFMILAIFGVLAGFALAANQSVPFLVACGLLFAGLLLFALKGWNGAEEIIESTTKEKPLWGWITALLALLFFAFVSLWTVARVLSFSVPTFDFGIFAQMFYNMKESGLPMTTVERDGLLSHFHVHMSPVYYLMLPFYMLVPRPETLQVLQAAVMASAVIPLYKIGKDHGLSGPERTLLCALLLLWPAFAGGASYDLHENCFLTALLLWLFWAIGRKNIPVMAITALLTLTVKEDAAVYVAVIALWLIVRSLLRVKKEGWGGVITGAVLLALSLAYFFAVTGYLAKYGDGVMTYRYRNFMYDGSDSLITVIKTVLMSPLKAVFECVDAEKLSFIALTMLPLLGLPLLTRRYERYILLIPYLLVNLMSDYQYQHDIFFQYTFGSAAFLFYLTAVNLADLNRKSLRTGLLAVAVVISGYLFGTNIVPKAATYTTRCVEKWETYEEMRETLARIPEGVPVSATTTYTTYLSNREILYDVRHATREHVLETEYVVISPNVDGYFGKYADKDGKNGAANFVKLLRENGYELYAQYGNSLEIYKKIDNRE